MDFYFFFSIKVKATLNYSLLNQYCGLSAIREYILGIFCDMGRKRKNSSALSSNKSPRVTRAAAAKDQQILEEVLLVSTQHQNASSQAPLINQPAAAMFTGQVLAAGGHSAPAMGASVVKQVQPSTMQPMQQANAHQSIQMIHPTQQLVQQQQPVQEANRINQVPALAPAMLLPGPAQVVAPAMPAV